MDPISLAITSSVIGKLTEAAIINSYKHLKEKINIKYGKKSKISMSIQKFEQSPNSLIAREGMEKEISNYNLVKDNEILRLAEVLLEKLNICNNMNSKSNINQNISGNYNIASGTGNITINR